MPSEIGVDPAAPVSRPSRRALLGLLSRRERWGLTARGWLALLLVSCAAAWFAFNNVYSFLAISEPVASPFLAVEGWLSPWSIQAAAREIRARSCEKVFTVGGPVGGTGPFTSVYATDSHAAYVRLKKEGFDDSVLVRVPAEDNRRDRTFSSAHALAAWINTNDLAITNLNVITEGPHARRSRLLFQKAFGPNVNVGVISLPPDEYKSTEWWRYSAGVKDIISEAAAYLYARLFFHPENSVAITPQPDNLTPE